MNVGCIPKKLMHHAGLLRSAMLMSGDYGWELKETGERLTEHQLQHNFLKMMEHIQNHIKRINFAYTAKMRDIGVDYINARASFKDENTLTLENSPAASELRAKHFVIAVGGRPKYPTAEDTEGPLKELCVTSDDLFWFEKSPGKTLVVGGGYIAIECAGFLKEMGFDVTLINRSNFLRVFDQDAAEKIKEEFRNIGMATSEHTLIKRVSPVAGRKRV